MDSHEALLGATTAPQVHWSAGTASAFPWEILRSLQKRRGELEVYLTELLGIRPLLRRELFNFLGVYTNVREFECLWRSLAKGDRLLDGSVQHGAEDVNEWTRLFSEGGYVTDTSPSASSLSSGSSWVDPDNGTLSETHSMPPFYLEGLVDMCYRMDELQGICENVVERLFKTRNRLDEADFSAIPNRLRAAFAQIGHRFHAFLDQHAHRTTIERLVSARTLMNVLLEINRELDSMQRTIDFDEAEWESTWNSQVRDVEENLVSTWEANVKSCCPMQRLSSTP